MDFLSYDGRDIILDSVADGVFTIDEDWREASSRRVNILNLYQKRKGLFCRQNHIPQKHPTFYSYLYWE